MGGCFSYPQRRPFTIGRGAKFNVTFLPSEISVDGKGSLGSVLIQF